MQYTRIEFQETSFFVDDQPSYANGCANINIRGHLNQQLGIEAIGVLSHSVNYGKDVRTFCCLLLFAGGKRLARTDGAQIIEFSYRRDGWSSPQWEKDIYGEWECDEIDVSDNCT